MSKSNFQDEIESLINRYSQENGSNTPDFILASYLNDCLKAWNSAVNARETWYGRKVNLLPVGGQSRTDVIREQQRSGGGDAITAIMVRRESEDQ